MVLQRLCGVSGVVGIAAAAAVVYFLIKCLKKAIPSYAREATQFGTLERFLKPTRFSSEQLAVYTRDYATLLSSGAYESVYKGELPNRTLVAVKVLSNAHHNRIEEQFMAKYMEKGSLDGFLFGDKSAINWCKMNEIAVGTVKGIAYLHEECEQRIVHYDIKLGNILLDQNLPRRGSSWILLMGFRGTLGYTMLEMWKPYPITYKCDVYSFGMLLFKIVGRRRNHNPNLSAREKALRYKPEARPTMSTVMKMLDGDMEIPTPKYPFEYLDPTKPYQLSENGRKWDSESSAFEDRVFLRLLLQACEANYRK
ncbi:hypothetical protein EUGRSUZ_C02382 [Eucalyptus grandis]|uniref:Uncharacterized protein n=2 Tax=Eucalyptus grandis TaxID=71139 RepID=A0ACC3LF30_EUCGR|nr:hypothetical protein EUGRSUZ_C02382 [Eucalyptus grandis]